MSTSSRVLLNYLTTVRNHVFGPTITAATSKSTSQPSTTTSPGISSDRIDKDNLTIVMGNPSADLDSFISAVVVSWFLNDANNHSATTAENSTTKSENESTNTRKGTTYVPLLNLTEVQSSELWRLRPEYGTALRLAVGGKYSQPDQQGQEQERSLLDQLMTLADVRAESGYALYSAFTSPDASTSSVERTSDKKQQLFLVDHNAPVIAGLTSDEIKSRFEVVGCIDHHVDEKYVPPDAEPRIIKMGIGSCTSLVVEYLRKTGRFPESNSGKQSYEQIAKLALAPVLIDTSNLKGKGDKCSDTDRGVVSFLESHIQSPDWDRNQFYHLISETKSDSLKLLAPAEMFARDFKDWTERNQMSGKHIKMGISSLVKPVTWIADHNEPHVQINDTDQQESNTMETKSPKVLAEDLVEEILSFVSANDLGLLVLLTRAGKGKKEIVAISFSDDATDAIETFGIKGKDELQLGDWLSQDEHKMKQPLVDAFNTHFGQGSAEMGFETPQDPPNVPSNKPKWRIWYQHDTSKSRKQVAPMMRDALVGGRANM